MPSKKTKEKLEAIAKEHIAIGVEKNKIHDDMRQLFEKIKKLNTRAADAVRKEFPVLVRIKQRDADPRDDYFYGCHRNKFAVTANEFRHLLSTAAYKLAKDRNLFEEVDSKTIPDRDILEHVIDLELRYGVFTSSVAFSH